MILEAPSCQNSLQGSVSLVHLWMVRFFCRIPFHCIICGVLLLGALFPLSVSAALTSGASLEGKTQEHIIRDFCVGKDMAQVGLESRLHTGTENVWELRGQAWGPITGYVHFGPLQWGGATRSVLAYRDPAHPIEALRDRLIFEGFAWGENVGWINMNTTQLFCNNITSYEQFETGLGFNDAVETLWTLGGPGKWEAFANALTDDSHHYLFATREKLERVMGKGSVEPLVTTVRKMVGGENSALSRDLGPYQISLSINGAALPGEPGKKNLIHDGRFLFTDDTNDTTYRVWVEGQAWSNKLGTVHSPGQEVIGDWVGDSDTTAQVTVSSQSDGMNSPTQMALQMAPGGQSFASQPPLQIIPVKGVDGLNHETTGQLIGALWSPRLGWMYFPQVDLQTAPSNAPSVEGVANYELRSGVLFVQKRQDICPAFSASPRVFHLRGSQTAYTLYTSVTAPALASGGDRKVHIRVDGATVMRGGSSQNISITVIGKGERFPVASAAQTAVVLRCHDEAGCGANGNYLFETTANQTIPIDVQVYPNHGDLSGGFESVRINVFGDVLELGNLPATCQQPPRPSCPNCTFPVGDEDRLPEVRPTTMCSVGNLTVTKNVCTDSTVPSPSPEVEISFYTHSQQELAMGDASAVTTTLKLYETVVGEVDPSLTPVATVTDPWTNINDWTGYDSSMHSYSFSSLKRIPLHRLTWIGGYTLKSGQQYTVVVETTSTTPPAGSPSGAAPPAPALASVSFQALPCGTTVGAGLTGLDQNYYRQLFASLHPLGGMTSRSTPTIPVEVRQVYVGFDSIVAGPDSVYKNEIYLLPHMIPLPMTHTETFDDREAGSTTIHSPAKARGSDVNNASQSRTRVSSISYELYRARVDDAGNITQGSARRITDINNTSRSFGDNDLKVANALESDTNQSWQRDYGAGDNCKFEGDTWVCGRTSRIGLFAPPNVQSDSKGRSLVYTDYELVDGESYVYFVRAVPVYEVWERNLLMRDSGGGGGHASQIPVPQDQVSRVATQVSWLGKRPDNDRQQVSVWTHQEGRYHVWWTSSAFIRTRAEESCGYGKNGRGISFDKLVYGTGNFGHRWCGDLYRWCPDFNLLINAQPWDKKPVGSEDTSRWGGDGGPIFGRTYWRVDDTTPLCLSPNAYDYMETINASTGAASFTVSLPINTNQVVSALASEQRSWAPDVSRIKDAFRIRNVQDYRGASQVRSGTVTSLSNNNPALVPVRYQLVTTIAGGNGVDTPGNGGWGRLGIPLFPTTTAPHNGSSYSIRQGSEMLAANILGGNGLVQYGSVVANNSAPINMGLFQWYFGRSTQADTNLNPPPKARYAIVPRVYYDAVFTGVSSADSSWAMEKKLDTVENFRSEINGGTLNAVADEILKPSLWDIDKKHSVPRPMVGMSGVAITPRMGNSLSMRVTTVPFSPTAAAPNASLPCYADNKSGDCLMRTITYPEFVGAIRAGRSVAQMEEDVTPEGGMTSLLWQPAFAQTPPATPSGDVLSPLASACTNVDGNGVVDPVACSTGGFVTAGHPVEVTVYDMRDIQCNYVTNPTDTSGVYGNSPNDPSTPYEVRIADQRTPQHTSYMYYWGGTSNPQFDFASCGTDFERPRDGCRVPVLISMAPDYFADRVCTASEISDPEGKNCVNLKLSNVYSYNPALSRADNEMGSEYQPIKFYVVGYDLLEELKTSNPDVAQGKFAPMYTGRWSVELRGVYFAHKDQYMDMDHQRIFFVVKPTVPVFTESEVAMPGSDGSQLFGQFVRHSAEKAYSMMGLTALDNNRGDLGTRQLPWVEGGLGGADATNRLPEMPQVRANTPDMASYQAIADGYGGYGVVLDLRDRFGNRLPQGNDSYKGDGATGKDTVELGMYVAPSTDATGLPTTPIATNQLGLNTNNLQNNISVLTKSDLNFGALQVRPLLNNGFAQVNNFTLRATSMGMLEYINRVSGGDAGYLNPLYVGRLVSIVPTLSNANGDFSRTRFTSGNENPVLSISNLRIEDSTGLSSARGVDVNPSSGGILNFGLNAATECGAGITGADCFEPKLDRLNDGSVRITQPLIDKFSAAQNATFQQQIRFYPALEVGCSLNNKASALNGIGDCGIFHLNPDPLVERGKYDLNRGEFQLINGQTERFLVVLRTNLTNSSLSIKDIEMKLHIDTQISGNVFNVEDVYVEKVCNVLDTTCEILDDIADQTSNRAIPEPRASETLLNIGTTAYTKVLGSDSYRIAGRTVGNGLAVNVLNVLSSTWETRYNRGNSGLAKIISNEIEPSSTWDPHTLFRLTKNNVQFGTQTTTPNLLPNDVVYIRFAGTPRLAAGATVAGVVDGANITSRLLYRVGATSVIRQSNVDESSGGSMTYTPYPLTAHYSEKFPGQDAEENPEQGGGPGGPGGPDNTVTTCQIDVRGRVRSGAFYSIVTGRSPLEESGSETYINEMKRVVDRNVAELLRSVRIDGSSTGIDPNAGTGTSRPYLQVANGEFRLSAYQNSAGVLANNQVIYIKDRDLVIGDNITGNTIGTVVFQGAASNAATPMPITFIVDGGNVILKSNIRYEECSGSNCVNPQVGFIVRQQPSGSGVRGGNIFIDPRVTNVRGIFYGEGSTMTAMDGWAGDQCGTSNTNNNRIEDCEILDGFSFFNPVMASQLYFRGVLISRNTIGGADGNVNTVALPLDVTGPPGIRSFRAEELLRLWIPRAVINGATTMVQEDVTFNTVMDEYADFLNAAEAIMTLSFKRNWAQRYDLNYLRLCGINQDTTGNALYDNVRRFDGALYSSNAWGSATSGLVSPTMNTSNRYPSAVFEYDSSIQTNIPVGFVVPPSIRIQQR